MVQKSFLLIAALAFLAVSQAFPAESQDLAEIEEPSLLGEPAEEGAQDETQDDAQDDPENPARTSRFLNRLNLPSSLSSNLESLAQRLNSRDRSTINDLLSSLTTPSPPSFLEALENALG